MRLSRCSRPTGPLERAPLTALWSSVAGASGASGAAAAVDRAPVAAARDDAGDRSAGGCDAWWTADERYVLRVAGGVEEVWYVGELEAGEASGPSDAVPLAASARPTRDVAGSRSMLVGRRRGPRAASGAMRLHVRRPPRA